MTPEDAVKALQEVGLIAEIEDRMAGFALRGGVSRGGPLNLIQTAGGFLIQKEPSWDRFVATVTEPGQVGTEKPCDTLSDAVQWILKRRPLKTLEEAKMDFDPKTLKEQPIYAVGDPVWIEVNDVNSPTGWWHGEVTEIYIQFDRPYYRAKITDTRLKGQEEHSSSMGFTYYDRAPNVNYTLYPRNKHTDDLIRRIQHLEVEARKDRSRAALREDTLLEALTRVTARGLSKEEAKEAILKKG